MSAASVTFALADLAGKERGLGCTEGNRLFIALVRLKVSIKRDCVPQQVVGSCPPHSKAHSRRATSSGQVSLMENQSR